MVSGDAGRLGRVAAIAFRSEAWLRKERRDLKERVSFFPARNQIACFGCLPRRDWHRIWRNITQSRTPNTNPLWTLVRRTPVMDAAAAVAVARRSRTEGAVTPAEEEAGCPAACRSRQGGSPYSLSPSCSWPGWPASAPGFSLSFALRASFTSLTLGEFPQMHNQLLLEKVVFFNMSSGRYLLPVIQTKLTSLLLVHQTWLLGYLLYLNVKVHLISWSFMSGHISVIHTQSLYNIW